MQKGINGLCRLWHAGTMPPRLAPVLACLMALSAASPARPQDAPPAFDRWLAAYRAGARERGLAPQWLDATLAGVRYVPRAVDLDRAQPDDPTRPVSFADYLATRLTEQRITDGRMQALANAAILADITARTGVPGGVLVAIWGMETNYGRITGGFDVPSVLATLAFDGRRADLFTRELDAAVRIVGEGRMARPELVGSWAGAIGQPQFLPSSYLAHAVDGDADGRADIRGSVADSLASIARYLQASGWAAGVPWGFRAVVPGGFDRAAVAGTEQPASCVRPMQAHSRMLPAARWRALGLRPLNAAWPADDVPMALVEPDGAGHGAFLVTGNYRAVMAYNCSNYYALSVTLLSDALQYLLRP
jgi:lytic murein transglycosylase